MTNFAVLSHAFLGLMPALVIPINNLGRDQLDPDQQHTERHTTKYGILASGAFHEFCKDFAVLFGKYRSDAI